MAAEFLFFIVSTAVYWKVDQEGPMEIVSGIVMILHHKALFHITSLKSVFQIPVSLGCGYMSQLGLCLTLVSFLSQGNLGEHITQHKLWGKNTLRRPSFTEPCHPGKQPRLRPLYFNTLPSFPRCNNLFSPLPIILLMGDSNVAKLLVSGNS